MAAENGRTSADLDARLAHEPTRFNFFQAVRLLERLLLDEGRCRAPVGQDQPPEREVVRFRTSSSLSFPASELTQLRSPAGAVGVPEEAVPPAEMGVAFLGLTGAAGVLPYHYTRQLMRQTREKDMSLRDWLDVFNHRLVSHFFRAWEKYRLPFAYERAELAPVPATDPATQALYCLVGLGTAGLRRRQEIDDETILFYGGRFAHYPRSAEGLEAVLGDYFDVPLRIEQLHGQWLVLDRDDQAVMPTLANRKGRNVGLGVNLVVGERVWDVQSMFRVVAGPLSYEQFRTLTPFGDGLLPLCQLARTYVGPELRFDVQLVLRAEEVPACQLGGDGERSLLGWNSWLRTGQLDHDAADAVFFLDHV